MTGLTATVALLLVTVTVVAVSFALYLKQVNRNLSDEKEKVEKGQREAEVRAASVVMDTELKFCESGAIEYGVLRLAQSLEGLPPHATELRQCIEMNLLAWSQELRQLGPTFQYDGAETIWELSPDGLTVLTGGADGTARLWDTFTGEVRTSLRGHQGKIVSVAFSNNSRVAMTVGEDRTVRLWDTSNGQARAVTAAQPHTIDKARLSPVGGRLLTISHEKPFRMPLFEGEHLKHKASLTLWDATTGKRMGELAGHAGRVNDVVFSPDGKTLLTGGEDGTARLWLSDNGRALTILRGNAGVVTNVAFSSDGEIAATLAYRLKPEYTCFVQRWDPRRSAQIAPPCKLADKLVLPAKGTPEEYQLGLRLAEKLSVVEPEVANRRVLVPIALYRLGLYAEALRLLEAWRHHQRVLPVVTQMGHYFLLGRFASLLDDKAAGTTKDDIQVTAFLAMAHHRLGNPKRAEAALDHLRKISEIIPITGMGNRYAWKDLDPYKNLLREAEALIEGKPRPGK